MAYLVIPTKDGFGSAKAMRVECAFVLRKLYKHYLTGNSIEIRKWALDRSKVINGLIDLVDVYDIVRGQERGYIDNPNYVRRR